MTEVMRTPMLDGKYRPIIAEVPKNLLEHDVSALDTSDQLLALGDYVVYCATASKLPHVMDEIGRLRETAFRAVGEGTGKSFDLDDFDQHHHHLFVWLRRPARLWAPIDWHLPMT